MRNEGKLRKADPGGSQILISVLMPAYNASKTIRRAICSTLRALPPNSELLVYLDGCTDDTMDVVSQIRDTRLKIFQRVKNRGIVYARNFLLDQAKGKFVANMDSDDICLPWRFRSQLKTQSRNQVDFLFTNAIIFSSSALIFKIIPQTPVPLDDGECKILLTFANPFVHSSVLAARDAIVGLGGYNSVPSEDYDLWLRAANSGLRFQRLRSFCVVYRLSPTQTTMRREWQVAVSSQATEIVSAQGSIAKTLALTSASIADRSHLIGKTNFEFKIWNIWLRRLVDKLNPTNGKKIHSSK